MTSIELAVSRESSMPRAVVAHLPPDDHSLQPQMSREVSMQSDKTKMVMSDRVMESPGPPPPSPEPKDQEDSLHDSMGAVSLFPASNIFSRLCMIVCTVVIY